jgi:hypothetical protein
MDATQVVIQAINGWLQSVAGAITPPALNLAGWLIFQTPSIPDIPGVSQVWWLVAGVADLLLVLALTGGGVLVMSSGTFEHIYTAKRLLPRLALAAMLSNASLALCRAFIQFENALVVALVGSHPEATLWSQVTATLMNPDPAAQVLSSLIAIVIAIIAVLLVVVYLARDLLLIVGTVVAPLALATYSLPILAEVAGLWCRAYMATLFVQVAQAVLVSVGLQLARHTDTLGVPTSGLLTGLVLVTLLYLSLRLPFVAYHWAFGHGVTSSRAVQTTIATAKAVWAAF